LKTKTIVILISVLVVLIFAGTIIWWHLYTPKYDFAIQAPGADNRPEGLARAADDVIIGEFFMRYEDQSSSLTGKWTCFRGEDYTNIVHVSEKIETSEKDYPIIWNVETGEGHASPVIYNGLVYFLDYDEKLSSDALRCFSLESGKELWRRWYRVPMKRNHGFSRTAPVINENYIITLGPQGHVMCCDPVSGDLKWTLDLQKEFKTEIPFWYAGQCPRVEDNTLILAPSGEEVLLAGIDCDSGTVVWQTPNTLNYKMSHSSVMPMTIGGKKMYIYAGVGGVCGISAEKNDAGALLWNTEKWNPSVIAPSPLQLSANSVFLVAGYGAGGAVLQIHHSGGKWNANIVEQYKPSEGMSSEQQTPILYNNMVITVLPKDGGSMRERLVCYAPSNLHTPIWTSGADERFGLGPYAVINNMLFAFKDNGELYIYEIKSQGMELVKKQQILDGVDAWGPMAYADGRLLLRDAHNVYCLKIN
jgi:outer membrane protein assembly factor BamB